MSAISQQKQLLRQTHLAARNALEDRPRRSKRIWERLMEAEFLARAETILCYVSARSEVETHPLLVDLLVQGKRLVAPYCIDDERLGLFQLTKLAELESGRFGILEPRIELRESRKISPSAIDLAILPGAVFDLRGNRIGYGKGYFDRLLAELSPEAIRCGLGFECQITAEVPTEPHDRPLDLLISEDRLCRYSPTD
ncbi:5-formyltetrahydrofolate cyclo-ligase [Blastopirellula marina]|uniref:5-formyltetrahydrofolate cyclo-ligase n=1 Tax=Blastopirellula marina TaxID=124 RepID=UPI001304804D|nr:5-formyltetrahydrofolate cyclo-ligase [Blastopirellula marina]